MGKRAIVCVRMSGCVCLGINCGVWLGGGRRVQVSEGSSQNLSLFKV